MTKVKEKLYEHRFGLFFFGFLMCFGLFFTRGFFPDIDDGYTISIYAVDFSVGFATRLLPGAIYNIFVNEFNIKTATIFFYFTLTVCYFAVAMLAEGVLKVYEKKNMTTGFILVLFFLSFFIITADSGSAAYLLDLHWFLSVIVFFICISSKKLYWFIPVTFFYAIMCHYACVLCYIPMFVLILIYKIILTEEKSEKRYLSTILAVSLVLSVGLFGYMVLFETDNLKYSYEEFSKMLAAKGIEETDYLIYPFYKVSDEADFHLASLENLGIELITIDYSKPKMIVFFQTVAQQMQTSNLYGGNHLSFFSECMIFLLPVGFVCAFFIKRIKDRSIAGINKFVYFNSAALFFFTLIFGLLFTTDTLRWAGHATVTLSLIFLYVILYNKQASEEAMSYLAKIPSEILYLSLMLSVIAIFR